MVVIARTKIANAALAAGLLRTLKFFTCASHHMPDEPEAQNGYARKSSEKQPKIFFEHTMDRCAETMQQGRNDKETGGAGKCAEKDEQRQALGEKAAGERHEFGGDG